MASATPGASLSSRLSQIDEGAPDQDERHTFIGGSEAFELLGEKQYGRGCARALAYRKVRTPEDQAPDRTKQQAISMRANLIRGQYLEDLAAQLYMEETGRSLIKRKRLVRHPDHPGAAVHTDRIILSHRIVENGHLTDQYIPTGDAEIKTHREGPFLNILRNGLPPAHSLQIQWSLFCSQHSWGAFIILCPESCALKHFDVERDPALMNIFAKAVDDFWDGLAHGVLPPQLPDASDIRCKVCPYRLSCRGEMLDPEDYQRLIAEREGKKILTPVFNDELDQALADRALIKSEMEALSSESEEDPGALQLITARIKQLVGNEEAIVVNKHWKVYLNEHLWSGLDVQRLKQEQPEIFKRYFVKKRPTGTKVLRVYAMHDGTGA